VSRGKDADAAFAGVLGVRRGRDAAGIAPDRPSTADAARRLTRIIAEALGPDADLLDVAQRLHAEADHHAIAVRPGVFTAMDGSEVRLSLSALFDEGGQLLAVVESNANTGCARLLGAEYCCG